MAARIEIKELGDPAHQKKITDSVEALDGVIETKIEKGALHISYDPLATTEKENRAGCPLDRDHHQSRSHRCGECASGSASVGKREASGGQKAER